MLKNLVKISIRNLLKGKFYTILNILGLTLGVTCSLFLLFFVKDELSYDRFFEKGKDIYRVVTRITETDNQFLWAVAQIPFGPTARSEFPEVSKYVRLSGAGRMLFKKGNDNFYEEHFAYADSDMFQVLTFPFIQGDPTTCLYEPNSIVLTKDIALKYFNKTDVVGETLEGEGTTYKITGVIKDIPKNSHLRDLTGFISYSSLKGYMLTGSWGNFGVATYLYTPGLKDPAEFEKKIQKINEKYCVPIFKPYGVTMKYELQNIRDIHLYSKAQGEAGENGDISIVYIFSAVAFFILLIAGINFMNLSTARSSRRAREVGIRKIVGSAKRQIIAQFLTESVILTLFSVLLSIGIVILLLPFFNQLLDKGIEASIFLNRDILITIAGIILFLGIVAGSYPAFFLSSFKPIRVLTSNSSSSARSGSPLLRKLLVVLQFGITVAMIECTWIVKDQLHYVKTADLGFKKHDLIRFGLYTDDMQKKYAVLRNEFMKIPSVKDMGTANTSPGNGIGKNLMYVENDSGRMVDRGIDNYAVDYDYIPTMGMKIVEGRNFSRDYPSDTSSAVLVTEAMARRMNWKDAIGKKFRLGASPDAPLVKVVGVVKDYHQASLYDVIDPILFMLQQNNYLVHVRIDSTDVKGTLKKMEVAWKNVFPDRPFEYKFLDESFDKQYQNDDRKGKVFSLFVFLTIVIACLGLLGLISYATEQRTREIGIRKVIGASVNNIILMISKEFILLVIIAIIISSPVSWYAMHKWLNGTFQYHINIRYSVFILSSLAAIIITFITIGYHTLRAAYTNPAVSLRVE